MLEGLWQNWQNWIFTTVLLVELWIDPAILEGNLELCPKGAKRLPTLWFSNTTAGFVWDYAKEIIRKNTCTKIFIAVLSEVAKNWKMRKCPSVGEWLNKLWNLMVMEYYCATRNNKLLDFHTSWKDIHELMRSKMSRTRRTLYTEIDTQWYNRT